MERAHRRYETQLAELTAKWQKNQDLLDEIDTKNLYLEAYSRRENIKFTNIEDSTEIGAALVKTPKKFFQIFWNGISVTGKQGVRRIGKTASRFL